MHDTHKAVCHDVVAMESIFLDILIFRKIPYNTLIERYSPACTQSDPFSTDHIINIFSFDALFQKLFLQKEGEEVVIPFIILKSGTAAHNNTDV